MSISIAPIDKIIGGHRFFYTPSTFLCSPSDISSTCDLVLFNDSDLSNAEHLTKCYPFHPQPIYDLTSMRSSKSEKWRKDVDYYKAQFLFRGRSTASTALVELKRSLQKMDYQTGGIGELSSEVKEGYEKMARIWRRRVGLRKEEIEKRARDGVIEPASLIRDSLGISCRSLKEEVEAKRDSTKVMAPARQTSCLGVEQLMMSILNPAEDQENVGDEAQIIEHEEKQIFAKVTKSRKTTEVSPVKEKPITSPRKALRDLQEHSDTYKAQQIIADPEGGLDDVGSFHIYEDNEIFVPQLDIPELPAPEIRSTEVVATLITSPKEKSPSKKQSPLKSGSLVQVATLVKTTPKKSLKATSPSRHSPSRQPLHKLMTTPYQPRTLCSYPFTTEKTERFSDDYDVQFQVEQSPRRPISLPSPVMEQIQALSASAGVDLIIISPSKASRSPSRKGASRAASKARIKPALMELKDDSSTTIPCRLFRTGSGNESQRDLDKIAIHDKANKGTEQEENGGDIEQRMQRCLSKTEILLEEGQRALCDMGIMIGTSDDSTHGDGRDSGVCLDEGDH